MHAAVIELDPLADPVRPAAEDDHLAPVARIGLAFGRLDTVSLVAGVHVRGQRRELGGAGIDALVDRVQLEAPAARRDRLLVEPRELAEPGIRKAHLLQPQKARAVPRQPVAPHASPRSRRFRGFCSRNHGSNRQAAWISAVVSPCR